jgi:hypothetical protein
MGETRKGDFHNLFAVSLYSVYIELVFTIFVTFLNPFYKLCTEMT